VHRCAAASGGSRALRAPVVSDLIDISELDDLVRRTAAAEIMPRFRRLRPGSVRTKTSPLDLVTDADIAAEAMITAELRARYPNALIVGEEAASEDPGLLDGLDDAGLTFVIDPVDGTANFAAGLSVFGVILAVLRYGEVVAGIVYDPVAGDSAIAVRGEGAWLEDAAGNRTTMRVATRAPLKAMVGSLSWRFFPKPQRPGILAAAAQFGGNFDFRCAAQHYRMIAGGHCHFMLYHRLLPWDHAAGWLLHREAGGHAAMLDGRDYRPSIFKGGYLCAPDPECWQELAGILRAPAD